MKPISSSARSFRSFCRTISKSRRSPACSRSRARSATSPQFATPCTNIARRPRSGSLLSPRLPSCLPFSRQASRELISRGKSYSRKPIVVKAKRKVCQILQGRLATSSPREAKRPRERLKSRQSQTQHKRTTKSINSR